MGARVLLTVDTELTWRHYAGRRGWEENFARSYEAAGVGVPYQLERLAAHRLRACFFVDPMPALVYGIEPVKRMVAPILEAGQEVQLHLHSFWRSLAEGRSGEKRPELTAFGFDEQRRLIARARDLLVEAGAPPPIAFRSGSYAADANTLRALRDLGFRYDSSHNGSCHPWLSAVPLDPERIDPIECEGIVEVPVGQIGEAGGRLRHLQLCAVSTAEMKAALNHAAAAGHQLATLVSHSFELATRDGRRSNGVVRRRFDRLCAFLDAERGRLPTATFADLDDLTLGGSARPLAASRFRAARRMAEQLWADICYERPSVAATAFTGSSAAGLELFGAYAL